VGAEQPSLAQRGLENPRLPTRASASRPERTKGPEFTFEREDWTLFRSLSTLSQKAGVPVHLLPKLVLKELADNALDAGGTVRVGQLQDGGWYVEDDGPGIAGDPGRSGTTARCSPPRASRPGRHAICSTCWASAVIEHRLEQQITEQILREAQIEEKVAAARQRIDLPMPEELHTTIGAALLDQPAASWRAAIERIADQLLAVQDALDGRQGHGT
jgi:hypothetical protein